MADLKLLRKIIYSFPDASQQQKEKHFTVVSEYIWKTIMYLAEQVAFELLTENPQEQNEVVPTSEGAERALEVSQAKKHVSKIQQGHCSIYSSNPIHKWKFYQVNVARRM
jgi:hypothetical protein